MCLLILYAKQFTMFQRLRIYTILILLVFSIFVMNMNVIEAVSSSSDGSYSLSLQNDLENLPDIVDGTSVKEKIGKDRILYLLNSEDAEVKRAFLIMEEYGTPLDTFEYTVPEYNTQLEILLWRPKKEI
ncbi:hypothetical protein SAMN04488696_0644 [Methanolobus profundi]|uniref:Uncharacterized protein n=2 Tax=Methanolobus profundi TaxID=487685 RepID=A0A1I4PGU1_9EURY|nr:hypothetical protein SAMN04488696_0644 [Methanolobus profundi]